MTQYVVDAFTDRLFSGNQAAVCVVESWPEDQLMQKIAVENNFSETAFVCPEGEAWHLRWFTPGGEIDFCGHATLGTAFVLFSFFCQEQEELKFITQVGELTLYRQADGIEMDFPAYRLNPVPVTDEMERAIGIRPKEAYMDRDLMVVLEEEQQVRELCPDMEEVKKLEGVLLAVTARGEKSDCVSRVFAPKLAIPEDSVTGSAHCMIVPYWSAKLNKTELDCEQASARSGRLKGRVCGNRVRITGQAVLFSESKLHV